jgi:flagellar hook-basal body complex protein FliE
VKRASQWQEGGDERDQFHRRGRRHPADHGHAPADHRAFATAPADPHARHRHLFSGRQRAGGGFTDALKSALDTVNASQTKAEGLAQSYEKGETVDVAKVMLARQEAGVAFEATLQVRNKLLTAYQDIMRMGV